MSNFAWSKQCVLSWSGNHDYDDIDNSDSDDDYSYDVGINQSQYHISLMSCNWHLTFI